MGLFGNMVRTMGQARAYFFLIRMCERHNRRTIGDRILSMNEKQLQELSAAYAFEREPTDTADDARRKLTALLIGGERAYDLEALDRHRADVEAA